MYNGNLYGDATAMMGGADYSGDNDDEGKLCFNGAKNYYLGWFSAYNEDLDGDAPVYSGELVPTNDVVSGEIGSSQDHVLRIREGNTCTNIANWVEQDNNWTCADYESDSTLCDGYGQCDNAAAFEPPPQTQHASPASTPAALSHCPWPSQRVESLS